MTDADTNAPPTTPPERSIRALPVVAVSVVMLTIGGVLLLGRLSGSPARPAVGGRRTGEPTPVADVDHYVAGTPPAVCEHFLRAWMRARYDDARDLSAGAMRDRAAASLSQVQNFTASEMEEYRRTRVYLDHTNYDLDHVEQRPLDNGPQGVQRIEVRGQGHAYGTFEGTHLDSRRGQVFTLEMHDGAWRVVDRTWETFGP